MERSGFLSRHWPTLLIGTMWLWMFWPMICGQTVCGFRDSAYLYYPLFKWIDSVWASGEIPLWNPYCNYGLPVVGDGSSSVFYPGKLIFLCRFLSYPSRYGIYLSVHVLIAAAGAYRFARVMKANQTGSTLAAISYAFGGSVLFQVTNIIYLVSAAWLPFALAFVWRGVLGGDWRSTIWSGVVCSLMILGGDPQMVYHVGLIAAASVLFRFWNRRRWLLKNNSSSYRESYRWLTIAGARLLLMVVVTSCLAAIQILPTAHWAKRSERAASGEVSNVIQAWGYAQKISEPRSDSENSETVKRVLREHPLITNLDSTLWQAFFRTPFLNSQKDATYQFSQPPWSVAELFFPNVMGKPFPSHQRWSDALPAAERIWTPSIYAGVLTILLALSQFRLWGKRRRHVWLSRIGLFFALASFGWFGVVWLLNEWLAVAGLQELEIGGIKIGPQVGGLYWFMNTVLPKYFMFRYPAKLFVIASLMISVLAGLGISTSSTRKRVNLPAAMNPLARASSLYCALIVGVLCIAGLIALQIPLVELWLGRIRPNLFFGPLDVAGTKSALSASFAHPLILIVMMLALAWLARKRFQTFTASRTSARLTVSIVLLTAFDVAIANHWMLAEVDSNVFVAPTEIGKQLEELKSDQPDTIPRIYRPFDVQARHQTWPYESSPNRLQEIVHWQRETLFPKHQLEHNVGLLGSFGSVWPSAYRKLNNRLDVAYRDGRIQDLMQYYGCVEEMGTAQISDSLCLSLHQNRTVKNISNNLFDGDVPKDIDLSSRYTDHTEIISHTVSTRQIIAEVDANHESRLRIRSLHDNGWQATAQNLKDATTTALDIVSNGDGLNMAVDLPPGNHQVTFTYSPREFWIGCWISGVSWLVVMAGLMRWRRRRRSLSGTTQIQEKLSREQKPMHPDSC